MIDNDQLPYHNAMMHYLTRFIYLLLLLLLPVFIIIITTTTPIICGTH